MDSEQSGMSGWTACGPIRRFDLLGKYMYSCYTSYILLTIIFSLDPHPSSRPSSNFWTYLCYTKTGKLHLIPFLLLFTSFHFDSLHISPIRDYGRGIKNCIHESMIPEWMDLVIWGNEHCCIPDLVESLVGTFRILQPGSSVVTSLVEGESHLHPKNMSLILINSEGKFRHEPIPFKLSRPFIYGKYKLVCWYYASEGN